MFGNILRAPRLLFKEVVVEGQEKIRELGDKQVVYFSNHLSMADFLIQGHVFWKENLPIPRFFAGENLNVRILGNFFRKCGAFYVDRGEKNRQYTLSVNNYIKGLFENQESVIIYAEGGRNYSGGDVGKLRTSVFDPLVDFVENPNAKSNTKDIYAVPVNINYDNRIEEWTLRKVLKNKEKRDNFRKLGKEYFEKGNEKKAKKYYKKSKNMGRIYCWWDIAPYLVRPFSLNKGNVYLRFGEPFLVGNYLGNNKNNCENKKFKKEVLADKVREEILVLSEF